MGRGPWSRWLPVAAWMAVIFYFSSQPHPLAALGAAGERPVIGILGHLGEYAGLGVLLRRALAPRSPWLGPLALSLAYGVSDELHQFFVPGRHCELFDVGCDLLGASLGVAAAHLAALAGRKTAAGAPLKVE